MKQGSGADLPVEVEAARLAIEWKHIFATELRLAAQRLAMARRSSPPANIVVPWRLRQSGCLSTLQASGRIRRRPPTNRLREQRKPRLRFPWMRIIDLGCRVRHPSLLEKLAALPADLPDRAACVHREAMPAPKALRKVVCVHNRVNCRRSIDARSNHGLSSRLCTASRSCREPELPMPNAQGPKPNTEFPTPKARRLIPTPLYRPTHNSRPRSLLPQRRSACGRDARIPGLVRPRTYGDFSPDKINETVV